MTVRTTVLASICGLALLIGSAGNAQAGLIALDAVNPTATFAYYGGAGCPLCQATATFALGFSGSYISSLSITFANTSGDGTLPYPQDMLDQIAFNSTPDLTFGAVSWSGLPAGKVWIWKTNGLGGFEFGPDANGTGNQLDAGESGSVHVAVTNASLLSLIIDATDVHFQSIAPGGGSIKLDGCVQGGDCTPPHAPEPASLVLLGTGLIGVARLWRKRRS